MSLLESSSVLINQYIVAVDNDAATAKDRAQALADLIANSKLSLVEFIQFMGPHLTSDTDSVRAKAIACLADTLDVLSQSPRVSRHDIAVLLDFSVSKLDDPPCVENALRALCILIKCINFRPLEYSEKIFDALRKQYEPRKFLARVRFQAFAVLDTVMSVHSQSISARPALSNHFVQAFLHVAVGEKDPRNLLHSFTLNTAINKNFVWDDHSDLHATYMDELFDVCFCYFPISFTPPAHDPYKISAARLKQALRTTIASQSRFAKDSFASLFEKLTSTNPAIRNDALETILECVTNYSDDAIKERWPEIWNALKFEILHNEVSPFEAHGDSIYPSNFAESLDEHDENKSKFFALEILKAIVPKLSSTELQSYCTAVSSELKPHVSLEKSKTVNSIVMLVSIASVSTDAFNHVADFLFSFEVWGKFFGSEGRSGDDDASVLTSEQKTTFVTCLGHFFIAYNELLGKLATGASPDSIGHFTSSNVLTQHKDHLLIYLGQLLTISSSGEKHVKREVIRQLVRMVLVPSLLSQNDVKLVFGYFDDLLEQTIDTVPEWESDAIVGCITDGIARAATGNEDVITELVFARLLCRIDALMLTSSTASLESILKLVGKICTNNRLLEAVTIRLFSRISDMIKNPASIEKSQKTLCVFALVESSIFAIQNTSQFLMNSWLDTFLKQIIAIVAHLDREGTCTLPLYETASSLVGLIIKFSHQSQHQKLLDEVMALFCTESELHAYPCDVNVLATPSALVSFVCQVLANVDNRTTLPPTLTGTTIHTMALKIADLAGTDYLKVQYLQVASLLVNKFETPELLLLVDDLSKDALQAITSNFDTPLQLQTFQAFVWLLKGMLVRMDKRALEYLAPVLEAFVSSSTSQDTKDLLARSVGLLFADIKIFVNLTPKIPSLKLISHVRPLNVKLLYKQRAFDLVLPRIVEGYHAGGKSAVYLRALSLVAENLPRTVLVSCSDTILPLAADGITPGNDNAINRASLAALKIIIEEDHQQVNEMATKLVPALLELAAKNTMGAVRLLALENMHLLFVKCPSTQRLKDQCLVELRPCLDDKKRAVRRACCDLRQVLYEM